MNLTTLTEYKGCDGAIRAALTDPTPEHEQEAWKAVSRSVSRLCGFFFYARELEAVMPKLLTAICLNPESPVSHNSATVKLLAKIFLYGFQFDEVKMGIPAISNDFSYYRRVLSRMRASAEGKKMKKGDVSEEDANLMSFHFAYPNPVVRVLISAAVQMERAIELVQPLTEIANVACEMALNQTDNKLLLALITGCVLIMDHILPNGVFVKTSPVRIRQYVTILRNGNLNDLFLVPLRFNAIHVSDDTTPAAISRLIFDP
jgi:hypothetical protein